MSNAEWYLLITTCMFGAMSPGPSLLCVIRHSVSSGRLAGISSACAHAIGVGLWAAFCVFGLTVVFSMYPAVSVIVSVLGASYLIWIGYIAIRAAVSSRRESASVKTLESNDNLFLAAVRDGFLIAFLNPKLAVFFIALFSQFLRFDPSNIEKIGMICIAAFVDGAWYILVASLVSIGKIRSLILDRIHKVDFIAGSLFVMLGAYVLLQILVE